MIAISLMLAQRGSYGQCSNQPIITMVASSSSMRATYSSFWEMVGGLAINSIMPWTGVCALIVSWVFEFKLAWDAKLH